MAGNGDTYPGDSAYRSLVQGIINGVNNDSIELGRYTSSPKTYTRASFADTFVKQHNTYATKTSQPNAKFLGQRLTKSDVTGALTTGNAYVEGDWIDWAGVHRGHWYERGPKRYDDDAGWYYPKEEATSRYSGPNQHQFVHFYTPSEGTDRYGWNESNPNADHVWGWDPKTNDPTAFGGSQGEVGTHVGFPFEKGDVKCLVWITPQEAFLECLGPDENRSKLRRTSAGLWGHGQWVVRPWNHGVLTTFP